MFTKYTRLSTGSTDTSEKRLEEQITDETVSRPKLATQLFLSLLYTFVVLVIGVLVGIVYSKHTKHGSADGFATDFQRARSALSLTPVKFVGTAAFHDNGTAYVASTEPNPYLGPPSPELDAAWDKLIAHHYIYIDADEARHTWGPGFEQYYEEPGKGYPMGFDVLHTLHCLNAVRKAVYPDYYPKHIDENNFQPYHLAHCIDILRQSIQCHGDITPIPLRYFPGIHNPFVYTDRTHTCRDFGRIHKWVADARERGEGVPWL